MRSFSRTFWTQTASKKLLTWLFSLLSSFFSPISFGFPLQKGQRTLPEWHLFPRVRPNKFKVMQSPGWPLQKVPKLSTSLLYSSVAESPITHMAGQKLAHPVCAKSHHSVPPFPHDGSDLAALHDALQGKRNKTGSKRSNDLLKQPQETCWQKSRRGENEPKGSWQNS